MTRQQAIYDPNKDLLEMYNLTLKQNCLPLKIGGQQYWIKTADHESDRAEVFIEVNGDLVEFDYKRLAEKVMSSA